MAECLKPSSAWEHGKRTPSDQANCPYFLTVSFAFAKCLFDNFYLFISFESSPLPRSVDGLPLRIIEKNGNPLHLFCFLTSTSARCVPLLPLLHLLPRDGESLSPLPSETCPYLRAGLASQSLAPAGTAPLPCTISTAIFII